MATLYRFRDYHPISFKVKQEAIPKRNFIDKPLMGSIKNQRGQAIVENILMLVVVVTLIMSSRLVFKSINDFMSDYMGSYIVCLMEYGELPSLGVGNDDLKKHEGTDGGPKCTFRPVVGAAGTGGTGSTGGPGSTGSTGSTGSSSSGTSSGSKSRSTNSNNGPSSGSSGKDSNQSSKNGSDGDASGGAGGRRGNSSASRSPYNNGTIARSGGFSTADNPQNANDGKTKVIDVKDSSGGDGSGDSEAERRRSRHKGGGSNANGNYKAITGGEAEIEKFSRREIHKGGSRVVASSDEGYRFMPLKRTFSPPEVKPPAEEKKDEGFSFGNFMKWIVIAGIVIAGFILFGGQVLSYSNSDE